MSGRLWAVRLIAARSLLIAVLLENVCTELVAAGVCRLLLLDFVLAVCRRLVVGCGCVIGRRPGGVAGLLLFDQLHPRPMLRAIAALSDDVSCGLAATAALGTLPHPPDVVVDAKPGTFDELTPLIAEFGMRSAE